MTSISSVYRTKCSLIIEAIKAANKYSILEALAQVRVDMVRYDTYIVYMYSLRKADTKWK